MNLNLSNFSSTDVYHLMTQTIIPRPIAWVLSENQDSSLNLAPFSYFNAVCSDPPLMMLSLTQKPNGETKDTVTNLTVGNYCVIHIAHVGQAQDITATAANLNYGHSEVTENNIQLVEQKNWPLPRVENAPIAYLCKVHSTTTIGNTSQQLIFVEAKELWVDNNATKEENGRIIIDAKTINPLIRLGANQYADLGTVLSKARPK
ncbi:flavin reductase family protein [Alteromonas sp. 5E99-2]|uniref:flavin reductase family protein n=1 Tax=Alteromonas sp. 5E99-2 TaxID=2817683 RepID=UPI001A97E03B|nr:flavin reductase family protein [Alteromonas sp. 5E99-2]MBO1254108.1 flavin reductase family protein [Alteromonas sp. 5E99-2]